jgi:hypothetical protein
MERGFRRPWRPNVLLRRDRVLFRCVRTPEGGTDLLHGAAKVIVKGLTRFAVIVQALELILDALGLRISRV